MEQDNVKEFLEKEIDRNLQVIREQVEEEMWAKLMARETADVKPA